MLLSRRALNLLRSVRLMSSVHSTSSHTEGHAAEAGHHEAGHHSHEEHHGEHHHGHEPEDPDFFYNKYGPFQYALDSHYTFLNQCRPEDRHNVDAEDPYRNEIQGYMFTEDVSSYAAWGCTQRPYPRPG